MKWLKDWVAEVDPKQFAVDAVSLAAMLAAIIGVMFCVAAVL